jgi:hypothetical protein
MNVCDTAMAGDRRPATSTMLIPMVKLSVALHKATTINSAESLPIGRVCFVPLARALWPAAVVHPHARGEHLRVRVFRRLLAGSSPRPWGTRMVWMGNLSDVYL